MKRIITITIAVVMLVVMTVVPAAASHGSHHRGTTRTVRTSTAVCTIENCVKTGIHYHNNRAYSGHYYGDGHDYHGYCDVADCTQTGYHGHDGTYHFAHHENDGHSYHRTGGRHH